MKNRKMAMGITAAVTAGFIGLATVYGAALSAHITPGRMGETETEETESETEIFWAWVDEMAESKDMGFETGNMMMAAAECDEYYAEPVIVSWNTEEYSTVEETGFRTVKQYPFSTFGMDVDTASYALLRRNILDDTMEWMPEDGIRIEEMINYFNYGTQSFCWSDCRQKTFQRRRFRIRIWCCWWTLPDLCMMKINCLWR